MHSVRFVRKHGDSESSAAAGSINSPTGGQKCRELARKRDKRERERERARRFDHLMLQASNGASFESPVRYSRSAVHLVQSNGDRGHEGESRDLAFPTIEIQRSSISLSLSLSRTRLSPSRETYGARYMGGSQLFACATPKAVITPGGA